MTEQTPLVTEKRKFRCGPMVRAERAEAQRDALLGACKAALNYFDVTQWDGTGHEKYAEWCREAIAQVEE